MSGQIEKENLIGYVGHVVGCLWRKVHLLALLQSFQLHLMVFSMELQSHDNRWLFMGEDGYLSLFKDGLWCQMRPRGWVIGMLRLETIQFLNGFWVQTKETELCLVRAVLLIIGHYTCFFIIKCYMNRIQGTVKTFGSGNKAGLLASFGFKLIKLVKKKVL